MLAVAPRRDRQVESADDLHEGVVAADGVAELEYAVGELGDCDRRSAVHVAATRAAIAG